MNILDLNFLILNNIVYTFYTKRGEKTKQLKFSLYIDKQEW